MADTDFGVVEYSVFNCFAAFVMSEVPKSALETSRVFRRRYKNPQKTEMIIIKISTKMIITGIKTSPPSTDLNN